MISRSRLRKSAKKRHALGRPLPIPGSHQVVCIHNQGKSDVYIGSGLDGRDRALLLLQAESVAFSEFDVRAGQIRVFPSTREFNISVITRLGEDYHIEQFTKTKNWRKQASEIQRTGPTSF